MLFGFIFYLWNCLTGGGEFYCFFGHFYWPVVAIHPLESSERFTYVGTEEVKRLQARMLSKVLEPLLSEQFLSKVFRSGCANILESKDQNHCIPLLLVVLVSYRLMCSP